MIVRFYLPDSFVIHNHVFTIQVIASVIIIMEYLVFITEEDLA